VVKWCPERVLLVEDDFGRQLAEVLAIKGSWPTARVDLATTADEATNALSSRWYDLVVLSPEFAEPEDEIIEIARDKEITFIVVAEPNYLGARLAILAAGDG